MIAVIAIVLFAVIGLVVLGLGWEEFKGGFCAGAERVSTMDVCGDVDEITKDFREQIRGWVGSAQELTDGQGQEST